MMVLLIILKNLGSKILKYWPYILLVLGLLFAGGYIDHHFEQKKIVALQATIAKMEKAADTQHTVLQTAANNAVQVVAAKDSKQSTIDDAAIQAYLAKNPVPPPHCLRVIHTIPVPQVNAPPANDNPTITVITPQGTAVPEDDSADIVTDIVLSDDAVLAINTMIGASNASNP